MNHIKCAVRFVKTESGQRSNQICETPEGYNCVTCDNRNWKIVKLMEQCKIIRKVSNKSG